MTLPNDGERTFIGVIRDVTERKAIERRLKSDAERLQEYFDAQEQEQALARKLVERMSRQPDSAKTVEYWIDPAANFSGDVVASVRRKEGRIFVMLADATGHGLTAAISALPLLSLFYAAARFGMSLESLVTGLNRHLYTMLPVGRFVAATIICLDENTGATDIWGAGMPELIVVGADHQVRHQIPSQHLPFGIEDMNEATVKAGTIHLQLNGGDRVVAVSDGVVEAANASGELFGQQRLLAALTAEVPNGRIELVRAALVEHLEGLSHRDDLSIVELIVPSR